MPAKRSKLEIYLDVLGAVRRGTHKPTRIMYRTNLSWKPMMAVLGSLTDQSLITVKEKGNHRFYEITEKGKNVLQYFSKVMESIEIT